jgi:hypothetical protein
MIAFDKYLGKDVVLITNSFDSIEEISGIRIDDSKLFKYKDRWVLVRTLTEEDLRDEDYLPWLSSLWGHNESNLKSFLRHKREYNAQTQKS